MQNYKSSVWSYREKCVKAVHLIIGPIWNMLYLKIIIAREKIKEFFVPLHRGYFQRRKFIQDALDRLSGHSSAGHAMVIAIKAAAMLLTSMFAVEFVYHFRPYYWKIIRLSCSLIQLCLIFIGRGTFWIYNVSWSSFCFISKFLVEVCCAFARFLVVVASLSSSVAIYIISSLHRNANAALNGIARVTTLLVKPFPIAKLVDRNNWKSTLYGVIALIAIIATCILAMLVWRHYKRKEMERLKSGTNPRHPNAADDSTTDDDTKTVICPDAPLGNCTMAGNCKYKHCPLPYCWQFRILNVDQWTNLSPSANVHVEKHYCDVENLEVSSVRSSPSLDTTATINFEQMTMQYGSTQVLLRRLSTPSYIQAPGKTLATKWTWYWKDDNGWKEYAGKKISSKITQENIETAYLSEEQVYFFHVDKFNYMITFYEKSMYQRNMDPHYSTKRCVRRRPQFVAESELHFQTRQISSAFGTGLLRIPSSVLSSLSNLTSSITVGRTTFRRSVSRQDADFKRITLASDNKEFQAVMTLFHGTIPFRKAQITMVEKIKNDFLLERYERKRDQMKKKLKASSYHKIEKQLFHGTTSEVINAICKQNFDHRLHGKNGTKYGEGSYFAVKASYSNNYSSGETRFMFVARVLTGEYKLGNASFRRPPLKDPSNPASDLYDSCVDSENEPTIFVIFNDEQCYPCYLITYKVP